MKKIFYFLISLMFLSSCDKFDWHNPYDPECPKELFTPSSPGATMEGNSVKLTWSQSNDDISGFALFRSTEGESITNLTQTQKSATQYLDASVTPGKKYTYYVLAVAGTNKSDTIKAEITPIFPITISTGAVTELAATSAKVSGNITSTGGGTVTSRGICWSTTQNPTLNNSKTTEGTGAGQYTSTLNGLLAGTTYFARAYGENSRGIVYGSQISFTTIGPPTLTTTAVSNITATSATSGGTIISDGGSPVTAKGIVWSTSPNPTIALTSKTDDGTGGGNYNSILSNLTNNTRYYLRAYAVNSFGTSYGEELSFITLDPMLEKLKNGLAAHYPFNGNANDESGNGNHGIVDGAISSTGKFGFPNTAFSFNGTSNTIGLPNSFLGGIQVSEFTFSTRLRVDNSGNSPNIWGKYFFWGEVNFQINPDNSIGFYWANSFSGKKYSFCKSSSNSIQIGNWVDISVVFQNSVVRFYVNGQLLQSTLSWVDEGGGLITNTQVESVCNFAQDSNTARFGARYVGGNFIDFLTGAIDEIRVYNRALTREEITYLANN